MAGTIPLSLTQQLDEFGAPLAGGHLYFVQAGTVSTPQNAYQDSALTIPWPNPFILDASGRIGQLFFADGSIKIRLTDVNGVEKLVADGILVIGASSGGGGGSPVDATTVLATGDIKVRYGTGVLAGFVRLNGRTIGSATSGASERANSDAQALFEYFWNTDANLSVSTGRGASSIADWGSNKTIATPDFRSRSFMALSDMGNSTDASLSAVTFSTGNATTLGSALGAPRRSLLAANLPAYTPAGTMTSHTHAIAAGARQLSIVQGGGSAVVVFAPPPSGGSASGLVTDATTSTFTGTAQGGTSTAFDVVSPFLLVTFYVKL